MMPSYACCKFQRRGDNINTQYDYTGFDTHQAEGRA
jgi:hypothetical protein